MHDIKNVVAWWFSKVFYLECLPVFATSNLPVSGRLLLPCSIPLYLKGKAAGLRALHVPSLLPDQHMLPWNHALHHTYVRSNNQQPWPWSSHKALGSIICSKP